MPRDLFAEAGINPNAQQEAPQAEPRDLFAEAGINPHQQTPAQQGLIPKIANTAQNTLFGIGDGLANVPVGLANLIPGVHMQNPQFGSGTAYSIGKGAGDILGFLGGGEAVDGLRAGVAGAEGIPSAIGKAADWLGGSGRLAGASRRALGSAGYGAVTNPDQRAAGALEGAGLSIGLDALPLPIAGIRQIGRNFNPDLKLNSILESIGNGQSLEGNAKSLAQSVKSAYESQKAQGNSLYQPVMDEVGSANIYDKGKLNVNSYSNSNNISGSSVYPRSGLNSYPDLVNELSEYYTRDIHKLNSAFLDNPTFQNAHALRSQLSHTIRNLQNSQAKGNFGIADMKALSAFQEGKDTLSSDMNSFLKNQNPDLVNKYLSANDFWRENVAPYRSSPDLSRIANGKITNPSNIANIFKNPEPDVEKIVSDLPSNAKDKIVYSLLGKTNATKDAKSFASKYSKINDIGLGSYISPNLESQVNNLNSIIQNRESIKKLAGLLSGGFLGHASGASHGLPEAAGAAGGLFFGPSILKSLSPAFNASSNAISNSYPHLSNALRALLIPGAQ